MATACLITGAWDASAYPLTFTFSDGSGGPYSININSGNKDHDTVTSAIVSVPTIGSIASAVTTAMNAASGKVYTLTFSRSTCLYTWSVNSGTFSVTFSAGQDVLGWPTTTGSLSAAATQTPTHSPKYLIKPAIGGLSNDTGATRMTDSIKSSTASSGGVYRLAPAYVPRLRSWEHQFEPRERVDLNWYAAIGSSSHLYNWEQLWMDYGTALLPLGCYVLGADGHTDQFAFALMNMTPDSDTVQRMRPNLDTFWKVKIQAQLWSGNDGTGFARVVT